MSDSLWGDLDTIENGAPTPPIAILKEQATLLNAATKGLVTASVVQDKSRSDGAIGYDFKLRAPALNSYEVEILTFSHGAPMYPARVYSHITGGNAVQCDDEDEFKKEVGKVLSHSKVKAIIQGLLSQTKAIRVR